MVDGVIYQATNLINGEMYIGQTIVGLSTRKKEHIYRSMNGFIATKFSDAIVLYGEENFTWSIIDRATTREELNRKEIFYIAKFNTVENGYNTLTGGNCSVQDGDLMAERTGSLPFYAFYTDGTFIGEYINKRGFEREFGVKRQRIMDMINNKNNFSVNIIIIDKAQYTPELLRKRMSDMKKSHPFNVFDKNTMEFIGRFEDITSCRDALGLGRNHHIGDVLTGKRKSSNGYIFKFV